MDSNAEVISGARNLLGLIQAETPTQLSKHPFYFGMEAAELLVARAIAGPAIPDGVSSRVIENLEETEAILKEFTPEQLGLYQSGFRFKWNQIQARIEEYGTRLMPDYASDAH